MPDTLTPGLQAPAAPMQRPPQAGLRARGVLKLLAAREAIRMSVSELESGSEELKAALDALRALSKLPSASQGLTDTEAGAMKQAVTAVPQGGAPQPGGPPPQQTPMAGPMPAMMGPG